MRNAARIFQHVGTHQRIRSLGSAGEHRLHTAGVTGSNPVATTMNHPGRRGNPTARFVFARLPGSLLGCAPSSSLLGFCRVAGMICGLWTRFHSSRSALACASGDTMRSIVARATSCTISRSNSVYCNVYATEREGGHERRKRDGRTTENSVGRLHRAC